MLKTFVISIILCILAFIVIELITTKPIKKDFTASDARKISSDYSSKIETIEKYIRNAAKDNLTCLPYIYIKDKSIIEHFESKGFTIVKSEAVFDGESNYYDIKWDQKDEERKRHKRISNRGNNKS